MLWTLEFGKDFIKTLLGMGLRAAEFEDYILSLKINPPVYPNNGPGPLLGLWPFYVCTGLTSP